MTMDEIFIEDNSPQDFDGVVGGADFFLPDDEDLEGPAEKAPAKRGHAYKEQFDDAVIRRLRMEGKSYRAIADAIGAKSPNTPRNRLRKMGLE